MSESGVIGIHPEVITGAVFFKNETTGLTEHMEVISTWRQAPISCLLIYFFSTNRQHTNQIPFVSKPFWLIQLDIGFIHDSRNGIIKIKRLKSIQQNSLEMTIQNRVQINSNIEQSHRHIAL